MSDTRKTKPNNKRIIAAVSKAMKKDRYWSSGDELNGAGPLLDAEITVAVNLAMKNMKKRFMARREKE